MEVLSSVDIDMNAIEDEEALNIQVLLETAVQLQESVDRAIVRFRVARSEHARLKDGRGETRRAKLFSFLEGEKPESESERGRGEEVEKRRENDRARRRKVKEEERP